MGPDYSQMSLEQRAFEVAIAAHKKRIVGTGRQRLASSRAQRDGFEKQLLNLWKPVINQFDALFLELHDMARDIYARHWSQVMLDQDYLFADFQLIVGRACLTVSEIRALLVSGHATGAMARWRTLYELIVVAHFIHKHSKEVADRYYYHGHITAWEMSEERYKEEVGHDPRTTVPPDLVRLRAQRDELVAKFDSAYVNHYGWASPVIIDRKKNKPKEKPTFGDIQGNVAKTGSIRGLEVWYKFTSYANHATQFGNRFNIQNPFTDKRVVDGPSLAGLCDPAWLAVRALLQLVSSFSQLREKGLDPRFIAIDELIKEMMEHGQKIEDTSKANNPTGLRWR